MNTAETVRLSPQLSEIAGLMPLALRSRSESNELADELRGQNIQVIACGAKRNGRRRWFWPTRYR